MKKVLIAMGIALLLSACNDPIAPQHDAKMSRLRVSADSLLAPAGLTDITPPHIAPEPVR